MTVPALGMRAIEKAYGGVRALQAADFEAESGEVHALLGENGAGKSTLVKVLSGAVRPDAGVVTLDGRELAISGPQSAVQHGIGVVFQELSLLPDLSVAANLYYGREPRTRLRTISQSRLRRSAAKDLADLGIDDVDPGTVVGELSLADRQVVEIAKVAIRSPRVVVFDEATSALARGRRDWLLALARRFAEEGRVVVFISHRMPEVRAVADRATVFRGGQNVGVRNMAGADPDELVTLMVGRRLGQLFPAKFHQVASEVALEVNHLTVGNAVGPVSFSVHKGEVLGVGGLAGQGQSELLLGLYGLAPAVGSVRLAGRALKASAKRRLRSGIALVPEDRGGQGLILGFSIRHNASLADLGEISNAGIVRTAVERRRVETIMGQLRLVARSFDQPVSSLSGGNQQKVVLAKMLLTSPSVLLLFDPTRGVDVATKAEIYALLDGLADRGVAIVLYSTDAEELARVCDRVVVMADGGIVAELRGESLEEEAIVRAAVGQTRGA